MALAVKLRVAPAQIADLLPAVGETGVSFIVTAVVPADPVHPFTVAVTEYVPPAAVVAAAIVGFCVADVKLFGPVHEYVAPTIAPADKFNVFPEHTGLLLLAVGAPGIGFTVAVV